MDSKQESTNGKLDRYDERPANFRFTFTNALHRHKVRRVLGNDVFTLLEYLCWFEDQLPPARKTNWDWTDTQLTKALTGWVFNPPKLNDRAGRITAKQVSRVISKIGDKALVIVNDAGKPASAHDLRRSFGQRLADAGVSPRDLQKIMRHQSMSTTEKYYLADDAEQIGDGIAEKMTGDVPRYSSRIDSPARMVGGKS